MFHTKLDHIDGHTGHISDSARSARALRGDRRKKGQAISSDVDALDRKILEILQQDATATIAQIGKKVGLSVTPCWKRIRKLERAGIIARRVAILVPGKVGLGLTVYVNIQIDDHSPEGVEAFAKSVCAMPEVLECQRVAGGGRLLFAGRCGRCPSLRGLLPTADGPHAAEGRFSVHRGAAAEVRDRPAALSDPGKLCARGARARRNEFLAARVGDLCSAFAPRGLFRGAGRSSALDDYFKAMRSAQAIWIQARSSGISVAGVSEASSGSPLEKILRYTSSPKLVARGSPSTSLNVRRPSSCLSARRNSAELRRFT